MSSAVRRCPSTARQVRLALRGPGRERDEIQIQGGALGRSQNGGGDVAQTFPAVGNRQVAGAGPAVAGIGQGHARRRRRCPTRSVSMKTSRSAGRDGGPGRVVATLPCQRPVRSSDQGAGVGASLVATTAAGRDGARAPENRQDDQGERQADEADQVPARERRHCAPPRLARPASARAPAAAGRTGRRHLRHAAAGIWVKPQCGQVTQAIESMVTGEGMQSAVCSWQSAVRAPADRQTTDCRLPRSPGRRTCPAPTCAPEAAWGRAPSATGRPGSTTPASCRPEA